MTSRGKQFEQEIRKALESVNNVSVDRFPDPMGGYSGFKNFCDIGVYSFPYQYYFECKERKGNTLNFKADITDEQWKGLEQKSELYGVTPGILVWFIDHDTNVFVHIKTLLALKKRGLKSLNIRDIIDHKIPFVEIPGVKRRVLFTYEGHAFMAKMFNFTQDYLSGAVRIGGETG